MSKEVRKGNSPLTKAFPWDTSIQKHLYFSYVIGYFQLDSKAEFLNIEDSTPWTNRNKEVKWRHCTAETRQDVYNCVASLSRNHHNIPQLANDDQQPVVFYNCKEF